MLCYIIIVNSLLKKICNEHPCKILYFLIQFILKLPLRNHTRRQVCANCFFSIVVFGVSQVSFIFCLISFLQEVPVWQFSLSVKMQLCSSFRWNEQLEMPEKEIVYSKTDKMFGEKSVEFSFHYVKPTVTCLTLSPLLTTKVPYASILNPIETPSDSASSNSASHPDPSCLTYRQHFHQL